MSAPVIDINDQGDATAEECHDVLVQDIGRVEISIQMFWPFYAKLDEVRQRFMRT